MSRLLPRSCAAEVYATRPARPWLTRLSATCDDQPHAIDDTLVYHILQNESNLSKFIFALHSAFTYRCIWHKGEEMGPCGPTRGIDEKRLRLHACNATRGASHPLRWRCALNARRAKLCTAVHWPQHRTAVARATEACGMRRTFVKLWLRCTVPARVPLPRHGALQAELSAEYYVDKGPETAVFNGSK